MVKKGRKKQKGMGVKDVLRKVNKFLKDTKAISTVARAASNAGYMPNVTGPGAGVASQLGYGKRRRIRFK